MTIQEQRNAISSVYPGLSWKRKVADMGESQVIAVYLAFQKNGTFERRKSKDEKFFRNKREEKREIREAKKEAKVSAQQISIFDIL